MKKINLSDVSATSLLTLYCHGLGNKMEPPVLIDPEAVKMMEQLNQILKNSEDRLYKRLVCGKLQKNLIKFICLRAKKFDEYVEKYLKNTPHGTVVNIGCGLDPRFFRIDNGRVKFYDLDFPEVIEVKKNFLKESDRYQFISSSALDYGWMERLGKCNKPPLFIAEGIFMYLYEKDVKGLVLEFQKKFPGSELVCEVLNSFWLTPPWKRLITFKMRQNFAIGKDAVFHFGIKNSNDMEKWGSGIQFLGDWSYFDIEEKKLGWLRFLKKFELFRKTQLIVHYRLGIKS